MKYAPYSFSKIQTYFFCQKKFYFTYVDKIPVDSEYLDPLYFKRGRFIHAYLADRLKGGDGLKIGNYKSIKPNDKLSLIENAEDALKNEFIDLTFNFETTDVEISISLDADLCINNSKANSAFLGFIDYYAVQDDYAVIIDWKSGKYRENPHFTQLELYAIWVLQKHDNISEIDLVFYYIEHNKLEVKTLTKDSIFELKDNISKKIKEIESTGTFQTNKTDKCLECPFYSNCK